MPARGQRVYRLFQLSLWVKGIFAALEFSGGIILATMHVEWIANSIGAFVRAYVNTAWLTNAIDWITPDRLLADPNDFIANRMLQFAGHFSVGTKSFMAVYLMATGFVKLFLFIELLRNRMWIFKPAIVALSLFVLYQFYRYIFVTGAPSLLVFASLDLIVIGLIWHTYRQKKGHHF